MDDRLIQQATAWWQESLDTKQRVLSSPEIMGQLAQVALWCVDACQSGRKVLFMGNGGSAADAQHLAGELVSRFNYDRPGLASFALTVDTSVLTAIGNDYGYERLFARQVQACGQAGDVLIGMSTSGKSPNLMRAFEEARGKGLKTVALTGETGGDMLSLVDLCVRVPSRSTPRIQECHITLGHIVCGLVEQMIFPQQA